MQLPVIAFQVSSVHRSMNERTQRLAPALSVSMWCECECHRSECASSFQMTMNDYESVRSDGRSFAVVLGHESSDESILARSGAYLVIEKSGEPGRAAALLDPREA